MADTVEQKVKTKIRTFAGDLEREKKRHGIQTDNQTVKKSKKHHVEIPKAEAPKQTKEIVREKTPIPEAPKSIPEPEITEKEIVQSEASIPKAKTPKPIPKITIKEKESKKIPAFHEIQKSQSDISKEIEKKVEKSKAKERKKKRPNVGFDAEVITDTKRNRFKFFPSLLSSISEWFKEITTPKKKKVPQYTVPETNRRKGIIQKATSETGTVFTADSDLLRNRVRERHAMTHSDDEHDTTWTPYTETGYPLLEGDVTQNVSVEFKKHTTPKSKVEATFLQSDSEPVTTTPKTSELEEHTKEIIDSDQVKWGEAETNQAPAPIYQAPEPVPEVEPTPVTEPEPVIEPEPEVVAEPEPEPVVEPEQPQQRSLPNNYGRFDKGFWGMDTNTQTILVLSIIIGLVILLMVARVLFSSLSDQFEDNTVNTITPPSALLSQSSLETVTIENVRNREVLSSINSIIQNSVGITETAFVFESGEEANPSTAISSLGFNLNSSFRESLNEFRIISSNDTDEVLYLEFSNPIDAQGGMLSWESTMVNDMKIIYEDMPDTVEGTFSDEDIIRRDVRILKVDGETLVLYGFINETTVLVARNISDFSQISGSIPSNEN